jgi:hypothetical protein
MGRGLPDEASTENGGSGQNWGLLRGGHGAPIAEEPETLIGRV